MKKVFLSIIAAAAMFVGCNADADVEVIRPIKVDAPTFSASFDAETRTSYEENQGYAKWIENEHLSIFNLDNHNLKYYIHNVGNNGKTADMDYAEEYVEKSGDILDQNYAIYPYSEVNEAANGVIYSEIPAVQTYNAESNFKNVPIVACSPDTSLSFSIPTAIYRYKVKKQNHPSKFYLKSITMTSKSKNIAGAIEIDMTAEKPVAVVTGDGKSVTLDLGENGVEITTTEQDFYIALPAISFPENDRTITCLVSKGGKDYQVVIEKDKTMELEAGIVKSTSIELKATSFTANSVYPSTGGELVGNLTLTSDFNLTQPLTVPTGEEATLNLNGHNITNKVENTATDVIIVEEGATLTINGNGNVTAVSGNDGYPIVCYGELIINDGVFTSGIDAAGATNACIYAKTNGKITINGGEFKSADGSFVLNLHDGSHATASIIVKGGKFHNFDPANNKSEKPAQSFVAEGYISVETSEGVWEVFPANEPVEVATAAALEDVLAQGGKATLTNDISLENTAIVITEGEATIDLNGKTITGGLFAESSGAITEGTTDSYVFWVKGGTLNIKGDGTVKSQSATYSIAVWADGGTVNIENGKFYNEGHGSDLIYAKNNGIVNIYGGYFEACKSDHTEDGTKEDYSALNLHGTYPGTITVYGGQFFGFDPANNASEKPKISFVAEGYYSVEVSKGVYEVVSATEIAGKTVCVASYDELKSVLAQGGSVKLTENISTNEIIVVSGSATIDGNGKTLTSSAGRAINVSGANGATIKNLTIEASGERAINIIQKSTNITIEGVTATASNYTVNVASSAPNAVVTINDSTFTGLNTINVSGVGAKVTIDNSKVNCNDNNSTTGESYAALCLNKDGIGGSIIATNCTINVTEGSDSTKGRNGAEDGTVTINGSTDDVTVINAVITFEGSDYYYSYKSLADAIEHAKNGNTITLIKNTVVEESVVIPADKEIVLDLNGKTISQENAQTATYAMIENKGTLTIKDSVGGGKVSYADTTVYTADVNYASNTISNKGTLTIESGIIENISSDNVMTYGYPHAIDVYQGSVTNIKGGTVKSVNYDCIRMFCNSTTVATTVNISGGNIINRVSFQNPSSNQAGYGRLNITGGTFTSTVGQANVRLLNFSTDVSNMKAEITGGTFDKGVSTSNYSSWTANWDWLTIGDGVTINKL
jgi:hypothetical protein